MQPPRPLDELEARLGYRFDDRSLLERALHHRSWVAEHDGELSNERLEFLGDAILGAVVAEIVFRTFEDVSEGALTNLRKSVVNATALGSVATSLEIGSFIRLGRGEAADGGTTKLSILSDTIEAIIAAIFLDGGHEPVETFIVRLFLPLIEQAVETIDRIDEKTVLQEIASRLSLPAPFYKIRSSGPDHERTYFAVVEVGDAVGEGQGSSKKQAEQGAAGRAVTALLAENPQIGN